MKHDEASPLSVTQMRLGAVALTQLSELAVEEDRKFDQAAAIAIHRAYLAHLDDKRNAAIRALNEALGGHISTMKFRFEEVASLCLIC